MGAGPRISQCAKQAAGHASSEPRDLESHVGGMGCDTPILCPLLPTSPRKQGPYHPGGVGASEHCAGQGRLGWQRTPSGTGQVTNRRLSRWTLALRVRAEESGPALFSLDLGAFAVTRLPYATEGVACALAWDSHSHADSPLRVTRVTVRTGAAGREAAPQAASEPGCTASRPEGAGGEHPSAAWSPLPAGPGGGGARFRMSPVGTC